MKRKIGNNTGASLVIVVLAMALLSIMLGLISTQVINQIKFNKTSLDSMNSKYAAESGIEKTISIISNQIENKVNGVSTLNENKHTYNKSTIDSYGKIKKPLIESYNDIKSMDEGVDIVKYIKNGLYEIIYADYNSVEGILNDINELKFNILTFENSTEVSSIVKSSIASTLKNMNSALVNIYSSEDMHNSHEPIKIETGSYNQNNLHVKKDEIKNKFLENYDGIQYNYTVESIMKDIEALMGNIDKLKQRVGMLQQNTPNYEPIYQNVVNKMNHLETNTVNHNVKNGVWVNVRNGLINMQNVNTDKNLYEQKLNNEKLIIINTIDSIILENMINVCENELYYIYMDYFNICDSFNDPDLMLIKKILDDFETIKINLIELKCKLGFTPIDIEEEITKPDPPITEQPKPEGLYIQVMQYEENLDTTNTYKYIVREVGPEPIVVEYNEVGNLISNVDDIELYIESEGVVNNNSYKLKAIVEFKTTKSSGVGSQFTTNYNVKSYEKIK